ncbi:hypothetical protein SHD_0307 [Shewanella decolorationis S12]|uniref:Uncharacterized protein n=1 Tax=Shewanella decolorationis S12 TaxID=1353536 RepID=A0ABP2Z7S3_9GAMM|nr:hypothetical protein SHD_0307 [Shewanella decolorationis S12]
MSVNLCNKSKPAVVIDDFCRQFSLKIKIYKYQNNQFSNYLHKCCNESQNLNAANINHIHKGRIDKA